MHHSYTLPRAQVWDLKSRCVVHTIRSTHTFVNSLALVRCKTSASVCACASASASASAAVCACGAGQAWLATVLYSERSHALYLWKLHETGRLISYLSPLPLSLFLSWNMSLSIYFILAEDGISVGDKVTMSGEERGMRGGLCTRTYFKRTVYLHLQGVWVVMWKLEWSGIEWISERVSEGEWVSTEERKNNILTPHKEPGRGRSGGLLHTLGVGRAGVLCVKSISSFSLLCAVQALLYTSIIVCRSYFYQNSLYNRFIYVLTLSPLPSTSHISALTSLLPVFTLSSIFSLCARYLGVHAYRKLSACEKSHTKLRPFVMWRCAGPWLWLPTRMVHFPAHMHTNTRHTNDVTHDNACIHQH